LLYDWKTIIEQEEKKTFDFFNFLSNTLPVIYKQHMGEQTYEEVIFNILPFNVEELIERCKVGVVKQIW
jgi:hypothetical protein